MTADSRGENHAAPSVLRSNGIASAEPAPDTRMMGRFDDRVIFALIVTGFLLYAATFIYRTSFVISGERYFSLFDDAMVSMRYARNLAHGYGLVWNPGGERIEGYTNPLWVLYMSLVHLLPVASSKTSLVVQVTAAVFLALNLYYVRRIALAVSGGSAAIAWGAVALTASYLPINNWSLQGMEVGVLVLLTTLCLWLAIQCMERGTSPLRLYLVLGISTLVRPDMVVPFGSILAFLFVADPVHRRTHLVSGLLVFAAVTALQTTLRLWYYGEVLPNTYYLKMTGVPLMLRISRGAFVLLKFAWKANALLFAIALVVVARGGRNTWLLATMLLSQIAYSVYVGGDAWEYWGGANRYICLAMPGFFILLSCSLDVLASTLINLTRHESQSTISARATARPWAFALLVAYAIVSLNSIYGPEALAEALLIRPPLHTGNGGKNQQEIEEALLLNRATTADATLAVVRAGTIPYFADRSSVDVLGKNDKHVAREQARMSSGLGRFVEFRPGHMKFDYAYSIGRLQPDVVVQLWQQADEAAPSLREAYVEVPLAGNCVYARRASPNILWDRLTPAACPR